MKKEPIDDSNFETNISYMVSDLAGFILNEEFRKKYPKENLS